MDGWNDKIAQRTMQGKTLMYQELQKIAPVSLVYGYQTSSFRKTHSLPKEHFIDALCIATLDTDKFVLPDKVSHFTVWFRPKSVCEKYRFALF